ncbi:MAG: histidine kinase dimerization/phospho-acceptor domain-containing protein, partial [Pseudomonadota bacterium]
MFFDDRLATVLRQRGDSEAGARTQFRQLLDILGNRKFDPQMVKSQSMIAAAWLRMDALAQIIPASERAAAIRERGWRFRNADLAAHLADFEPEVASAALHRAQLTEEDWTALIPRLPVRARGFLRRREDLPLDAEAVLDRLGVQDRGLPQPGQSSSDDGPRSEPASDESIEDTPQTPPRDANSAAFDLSPANEPFVLNQEAPREDEEDAQPFPEFSRPSGEGNFDAQFEQDNDPSRSEISALVERIAQFKRERESAAPPIDSAPLLPLEEYIQPEERKLRGFGFTVDAAGRIDWAEPEAAAMVIGKRIVPAQAFANPVAQTLIERAFERRQPITHAQLDLAGAEAISGGWIVDAQPRFTDEGNFAGYVGRFRRPVDSDRDAKRRRTEADRIRQLLHELRTPVTAVQGYAEVIQQQLFGPARHEYRALAAAIAADAARILAGFEELDRLARLEGATTEISAGESDLGGIISRITTQLSSVLGPRMAGIEFAEPEGQAATVAIDPEETEALIWRLLATLGGNCASGETITCVLRHDGNLVRLVCDLPAQLIAAEDVFTADVKPSNASVNPGLFGAGFTLRLARAEAR